MAPFYAHCPRCGFPAVVHGIDRGIPRHCRQCKDVYIPQEPHEPTEQSTEGTGPQPQRPRRLALRSLLQHMRGTTTTRDTK